MTSERAMYSASVELRETLCCLRENQATGDPSRKQMPPLTDLRLLRSDAQSESDQSCTLGSGVRVGEAVSRRGSELVVTR